MIILTGIKKVKMLKKYVAKNIKMGLNVWDYSDLPFNFMGQVSLIFSIFWFFLSIVAIWLDDYLRYKFYNDKRPNDLYIYIKNLLTFRKSR